jgi:hypothetical protein
VAYPDLVNGGACPKGFEKRLPSLFFETIWNTYAFKGVDGTFMWANGDPTGYGYHGDFMNGWSTDILSKAVKTCLNLSGKLTDCPVFKLQTEAEGAKCLIETPKELKEDNCDGPAKGICGNVSPQYGPNYATMLTPGNTASPTAKPSTMESSKVSAVPTLSHTAGGVAASSLLAKPSSSASSASSSKPSSASASASSSYKTVAPSSAPSSKSTPAPAASSKPTSSSRSVSYLTAMSWKADPGVKAAAVTSAPSVPADQPKVLSTSTYTSAGAVYHLAIEEVVVTVTATATPSPKAAKRHAHHMHHKRDREHGLLRQN